MRNQFVCRRCAECWNVARGGRIEEDVGHFIELYRCVRQIEHCHSFQFRFGATQPHDLVSTRVFGQHLARDHAPRILLGRGPCKPVPLLDIYRLKFEVFASLGWVLFYIGAVCGFHHTHVSQLTEGNRRRGGDDQEEAALVICYIGKQR